MPFCLTHPFCHYQRDFQGIDEGVVDNEKTFYEIPHWMHLSFADYDTDGDSSVPSQPQASPPRLNGGQIRSDEQTLPVATHAALISGRQYEDILEACSPRVSTQSLPPALMALLRGTTATKTPTTATNTETEITATKKSDPIALQSPPTSKSMLTLPHKGVTHKEGTQKAEQTTGPEQRRPKELVLHEWGGINTIRASPQLMIVARGRSETALATRAARTVGGLMDRESEPSRGSEFSPNSNASSSLASRYSARLSERSSPTLSVFAGHPDSIPTVAAGVERTPSMEFHPSLLRDLSSQCVSSDDLQAWMVAMDRESFAIPKDTTTFPPRPTNAHVPEQRLEREASQLSKARSDQPIGEHHLGRAK